MPSSIDGLKNFFFIRILLQMTFISFSINLKLVALTLKLFCCKSAIVKMVVALIVSI